MPITQRRLIGFLAAGTRRHGLLLLLRPRLVLKVVVVVGQVHLAVRHELVAVSIYFNRAGLSFLCRQLGVHVYIKISHDLFR